MKDRYERETVERSLSVGDKVLILLTLPGHRLKARFHGLYKVVRKASDLNDVRTPDRRKSTQIYHINILKLYYERRKTEPVLVISEPIVRLSPQRSEEVLLKWAINAPKFANLRS